MYLMAIFIRSELEKEIERIKLKLEKDFGCNMSKTNTVRNIVNFYKEKNNIR